MFFCNVQQKISRRPPVIGHTGPGMKSSHLARSDSPSGSGKMSYQSRWAVPFPPATGPIIHAFSPVVKYFLKISMQKFLFPVHASIGIFYHFFYYISYHYKEVYLCIIPIPIHGLINKICYVIKNSVSISFGILSYAN